MPDHLDAAQVCAGRAEPLVLAAQRLIATLPLMAVGPTKMIHPYSARVIILVIILIAFTS